MTGAHRCEIPITVWPRLCNIYLGSGLKRLEKWIKSLNKKKKVHHVVFCVLFQSDQLDVKRLQRNINKLVQNLYLKPSICLLSLIFLLFLFEVVLNLLPAQQKQPIDASCPTISWKQLWYLSCIILFCQLENLLEHMDFELFMTLHKE